MKITETPEFSWLNANGGRLALPLGKLLRRYGRNLPLGSLAMVASYACFSIASVFVLDYGTQVSSIPRVQFPGPLCISIFAAAATTVISAALADRFGSWRIVLVGSTPCMLAGFALAPLLGSGSPMRALLCLSMCFGMMGIVLGPMGAVLSGLFPIEVRYSGASVSYNLGDIPGASFTPYAARLLLAHGGLSWVGAFVTLAGAVTFIAMFIASDTPIASRIGARASLNLRYAADRQDAVGTFGSMATVGRTREIGFFGDGHEVTKLSQFHEISSVNALRSQGKRPAQRADTRRSRRHTMRAHARCRAMANTAPPFPVDALRQMRLRNTLNSCEHEAQ
ncbi:hypothetical protein LMG29739_01267 [Paraburkholderia solisilvae]|uniref:Major facilitator superfamily (MFS) profile domain-containing protein n=1 Tax=Paraburkholderia solisilvae TaxID=624376 RepID=A0A6J5DEM9_9BURK|nr:hypothetical protein LMG29739_01267 [Paraburkholderia solisilvae]